jgi:hypothetical protein
MWYEIKKFLKEAIPVLFDLIMVTMMLHLLMGLYFIMMPFVIESMQTILPLCQLCKGL